jgi:uncharacterized repeat protein (TIGR01451 family)
MGRRILLISGMLLVTLSTAPGVRGQGEEPKPPPPPSVPSGEPAAPAELPQELRLPVERDGAEDDRPGEPAKRMPSAKVRTQAKAAGDADSLGPPAVSPGWKNQMAAPLRDDKVIQAQATAGPADQPAGAGSGDTPLPASERLPLGKQSVAVTVDVQSPKTMNLNKDATLKLIVRNTGLADAFNLQVHDELPDGLRFLSSLPDMRVAGGGQHLSLLIPTLPAGQDRVITIKVKPTKTGPFDHAATVRFETGCKSRTTVLQPRLKVDIIANPTVGKVLKGQQVTFDVSVQNTGDGVARKVAIQAKLSPGLRHESGPRGEGQMLYELSLPELGPGATEKLDPLVADAMLGGEQFCTVTAQSPDVEINKEESENTKKIEVVEPKLKLAIDGPDQRYTDRRLQAHAREPRDCARPQGPRAGDAADQRTPGQGSARSPLRQVHEQARLDD